MSGTTRPLRDVLASGIRGARTRAGLRQEDAAARLRALGLSTWLRGTVAQVEVGARRVTLDEVIVLALAYETSVVDLLEDTNDKVQVSTEVRVPSGVVRRLLSGQRAAPEEVQLSQTGSGLGEAERHAARRLQVSIEQVTAAAMTLWGRPLSDERDRRLADRGTDLSPRQRQAVRGHVTRELIAELVADFHKPPPGRVQPDEAPKPTRTKGGRA